MILEKVHQFSHSSQKAFKESDLRFNDISRSQDKLSDAW